ncbi:hypothetical protein AB0J90_18360 [Micromonospora sp. NPDC049523]|uniref:hypothetical protein n=1 Tax=Micromonospora sp. NPDC049523 TaxID=3155921 RepID=UPI00344A925E
MGDTGGDSNSTAPAMGDWDEIRIASMDFRTPASMFDYVDIKYGGTGSSGCINAAVNVDSVASRTFVTNSTFAATAGGVYSGAESKGIAAVYNSQFLSGTCGVSVYGGARAEIIGNTFGQSLTRALHASNPGKIRFWFNQTEEDVSVFNLGGPRPTRTLVDVRYNTLLGGVNGADTYDNHHSLDDWSGNWFGHDANAALPTCMDPAVAASLNPPVRTQASTVCPAGQQAVVGYRNAVVPALSASPQVLPEAARETAAPRFGPVNTYTGALTYQVQDLAVQDAGKQLTATRTYRSDRLAGGDAG